MKRKINTNKFIAILTLVSVFVLTLIFVINSVNSTDIDIEKTRLEIAEKYGVDPEYIGFAVSSYTPWCFDDYQLSEKELKSDTETLIDLCFNSDYFHLHMGVLSSIPAPYAGFYEIHKKYFNGFEELSKREDAAECLQKKYDELFAGTDLISDIRCMMESMLMSDDFK